MVLTTYNHTAEMDLIMWNKEPWLKLENWHLERKFTQHHVSHGSIYLKWKMTNGLGGGASWWRVCYQRAYPV